MNTTIIFCKTGAGTVMIGRFLCIALLLFQSVTGFLHNIKRNHDSLFRIKEQSMLPRQHRPCFQILTKTPSLSHSDNVGHSHATTALHLFGKNPIIDASDNWGNLAFLTGMATLSQVLGKTTRVGKLLGPPVTAMAITFCMASVGIINPGGTVAAKSLQLLSLQLATPLILLGADLRDCFSRCGPLLFSFLVASLATVIACSFGWYLFGNLLTNALGKKDSLVIAAALMAKNIGGGINYVAVCRSLSASPAAIAAGLCVDNIFALLYFPITSALASGRPDVITINSSKNNKKKKENISLVGGQEKQQHNQPQQNQTTSTVQVQHVSTVLFLSAFLLWLGEKIGGVSGALPCCTLLTVILASLAPVSLLEPLQQSANTLGTVCLYLFFATAGAPGIAVAESVRASLFPLTLFLLTLYGIHGIILKSCHTFWGDKFPSFQPQRLLVASSAAIGGPATAVALAHENKWHSLEVPSLLVGNIGYAIATFCALGYHVFISRV